MAEKSTATEIQVSFIVSAPEATSTVDLCSWPAFLRWVARRYFAAIEAIRMMITGRE